MTQNTKYAVTVTDEQIAALKAAALAATPQNIDGSQQIEIGIDGQKYIACPHCGGEGNVELEADYCNCDGAAIGVQFYGIGNEFGAAEAYFRAASPANVLALIARLERAEIAPPAEQPEGVLTQAARDVLAERSVRYPSRAGLRSMTTSTKKASSLPQPVVTRYGAGVASHSLGLATSRSRGHGTARGGSHLRCGATV